MMTKYILNTMKIKTRKRKDIWMLPISIKKYSWYIFFKTYRFSSLGKFMGKIYNYCVVSFSRRFKLTSNSDMPVLVLHGYEVGTFVQRL